MRARFFSCVTNKWYWRRAISVTLQRIASRGNRQDTKRSATAKQMHEATGLTVLILLLARLSQRLPCELSSSMQTVCERMKRNEVELNERTLCLLPSLTNARNLITNKCSELKVCEAVLKRTDLKKAHYFFFFLPRPPP